ncbi:HEAT repeat domain-containing protein [Sorangium sp. So ce341]|uniref:HEAT repeat domain-containing protein n=1 Tax=Sorangium sp. So ce341 TaxID=3133302 RepID=UPI003F5E6A0B
MTTWRPTESFLIAARRSGAAYRRARRELVHAGTASEAFARRAAQEGRHWKTRLTAQMLLGWMRGPKQCRKVAQLMRAAPEVMPPCGNVTGRWSAADRGEAIAALGSRAVPRILEILLKTREVEGPVEVEALYDALARLRDPRSVRPLLEVLRGHAAAPERALAARVLARLDDGAIFHALVRELMRSDNAGSIREACAEALSDAADARSLAPLLKVARGRCNALALRGTAVVGLAALGDTRAGPSLVRSLDLETDEELLALILQALVSVGDRTALPAMRRIAEGHPDPYLRREAQQACGALLERLGGPG